MVLEVRSVYPRDRKDLKRYASWIARTVDGKDFKDWTDILDPRYGIIHHVIVENEDGSLRDKIDIEWKIAAFVVVFRRNDDRVEFLLPSERRILLKDRQGKQGNIFIRNIPQGLVMTWDNETSEEAALRELREETGLEPKSLIRMQDVYFDAANSQTAMPFFLAEVENKPHLYEQSLGTTEDIRVGEEDWFALEDIPKLRLQCAKTMSGILLATGYLGLWQNTGNGQRGTNLLDSSELPLH